MPHFALASAAAQLALCSALSFLTGAVFSIGVFTIPVERATPSGALDGYWPAATAWLSLLSAPLMIVSGAHLSSQDATAQRTYAARWLGVLAAAGYVAFAAAGLGVANSSRPGVSVGVAALALPLGMYTLLLNELAVQWHPRRPGTAVGLLSFSAGCGTAFFARLFSMLADVLAVPAAISCAGAMLGIAALGLVGLLRFPPGGQDGGDTPPSSQNGEETALICPQPTDDVRQLSLHGTLTLPHFWLYISTTLSANASFAMVPYFFKIGDDYGIARGRLVDYFELYGVIAVVASLVVPTLTPFLRARDGLLSSGSRNVVAGVLLMQTCVFFSIALPSPAPCFVQFSIAALLCRVALQINYAAVVLLAFDMFGGKNTAIVFGTGGGLALGTSEFLSVSLMYWSEKSGQPPTGASDPSVYRSFYVAAALWSLIGLWSVLCMRRIPMGDGERLAHQA